MEIRATTSLNALLYTTLLKNDGNTYSALEKTLSEIQDQSLQQAEFLRGNPINEGLYQQIAQPSFNRLAYQTSLEAGNSPEWLEQLTKTPWGGALSLLSSSGITSYATLNISPFDNPDLFRYIAGINYNMNNYYARLALAEDQAIAFGHWINITG